MKKLTRAEFAALGGWKEKTFTSRRKLYEQKMVDKGYKFEIKKEGKQVFYLVEEGEVNLEKLSTSEKIEALFKFKPRRPQLTYDYLKLWYEEQAEFEILSDTEVAKILKASRQNVQAVRQELTPTYMFPLKAGGFTYRFKNLATGYVSEEIDYEEYRDAQWAWTNAKRAAEQELASRIGDGIPIIIGDTRYNNDRYINDDTIELIIREAGKAKMIELYGGYPTRTPKKLGSYNVQELMKKLFK